MGNVCPARTEVGVSRMTGDAYVEQHPHEAERVIATLYDADRVAWAEMRACKHCGSVYCVEEVKP